MQKCEKGLRCAGSVLQRQNLDVRGLSVQHNLNQVKKLNFGVGMVVMKFASLTISGDIMQWVKK